MTKQTVNTDSENLPQDFPDINRSKIDLEKAIDYRLKGLTYQDIADIFGCAKQSVHERLQKVIPNVEDVAAYDKHKAKVLSAKELLILNNLTIDSIKKAPLAAQATAYGILFDKRQLHEGKATANVAHADITRDLQEILTELRNRGLNPVQPEPYLKNRNEGG